MPLASAPASSTSDSVCVVGQPLTSSFSVVEWCQFETNIDIDLLAVRVLKFRGTRVANSNRSQCSRHGAAALGARMSLLDRFARVVKSYANAIISSMEDPEKILEQTVLEMNDDLIKMRQATAQDNASALKAQFDQQKNVIENLAPIHGYASCYPACIIYALHDLFQ
ncbi:hypothetical protein AAG906_022385 [Vitis piasezkii]